MPALVTAVALAPFVVMGDVPGMELLHTAAAVILGGLATTTLVCLVVLPVRAASSAPPRRWSPTRRPAGIAMADGADMAAGVAVPGTRQPPEACTARGRSGGATWNTPSLG